MIISRCDQDRLPPLCYALQLRPKFSVLITEHFYYHKDYTSSSSLMVYSVSQADFRDLPLQCVEFDFREQIT